MQKFWSSVSLVVLLSVVLSCSIANRITGDDQRMKRSTDLWPDVPRIDGLAESEMEMPLAIKVLMRTVQQPLAT